MMNKCKLSELKHNTLNPREVAFLEAKDEEEVLVAEGANSFVIIMDKLDNFPKIALILHRRVHIVKYWNILSKNTTFDC